MTIETSKSYNQHACLLCEDTGPLTMATKRCYTSPKMPLCIEEFLSKYTLSFALIYRHLQPHVRAAARVMAPGLLLNTD